MSYLLTEEVVCTYCKFPSQAEVWSVVNVKEDPELRELLLGGEFNLVECESCRKVFYVDHLLVYHDPNTELMAFVYPLSARENRELYVEKTRLDFSVSQENALPGQKLTYEALTLFGLDELIAVVEWDEEAEIQGEIVALLAEENGFGAKKLRPSVARREKLPTVLPFADKEKPISRESILAGLGLVLNLNDRLTIYGQAREIILKNPDFELHLE